jgi:3-oxoacyl-(acyl-carrier-protein) synthase
MRRTSPISQFVVAAAHEAMEAARVPAGMVETRLGVVVAIFNGCIGYSRRFFGEVLSDPATASPMVFPETVFNAPSSHLSAVLGARAANYTLVGDEGAFANGLAMACQWLGDGWVDGCLVVGAEEADPITADAVARLEHGMIVSEGAGAVYVSNQPGPVEIMALTEPELFFDRKGRTDALERTRRAWRATIGSPARCVGNVPCAAGMPAVVPEAALGHGMGASGAWHVVLAAEAVRSGECDVAVAETAGSNEQVVSTVLRRDGRHGATA